MTHCLVSDDRTDFVDKWGRNFEIERMRHMDSQDGSETYWTIQPRLTELEFKLAEKPNGYRPIPYFMVSRKSGETVFRVTHTVRMYSWELGSSETLKGCAELISRKLFGLGLPYRPR